MAHPLIAAGVAAHSSFRASPVTAARRLHETVRAMLGLTFGTDEEQARVIAGILAIHRRVNGQLQEAVGPFAAGTHYSAEDPELVLWVHTTLLESTIVAYEAIVGPISPADRDTYCAEAAPVAIALGAHSSVVPTTWAGVLTYVADVRASHQLAVGSDARLIADALLSGPFTTLAGPAGWANRLVTIGWLPDDVRAMYGLAWDERRARSCDRVLRTIRVGRRVLPTAITHWPAARRLRRAR
jgi:uncharacterized protein (DUF2236 family)